MEKNLNYVKSAKFESGCLLIVNEEDKLIRLDFSNVASALTLAKTVKALEELTNSYNASLAAIEQLKMKLEDGSPALVPEGNNFIHLSGNEKISGTKSFRRLKISNTISDENPGITMSYNETVDGRNSISLYSSDGAASISVQRDPHEGMEVATKQYIDDRIGLNETTISRIAALEDEILLLKSIVEDLRNK